MPETRTVIPYARSGRLLRGRLLVVAAGAAAATLLADCGVPGAGQRASQPTRSSDVSTELG